jgi:hypothetical protein
VTMAELFAGADYLESHRAARWLLSREQRVVIVTAVARHLEHRHTPAFKQLVTADLRRYGFSPLVISLILQILVPILINWFLNRRAV